MITVIFTDPAKWPLSCSIEIFNLTDVSDVKSVTLEGEALALAAMEFVGIPIPRYINEWDKVSWYWTDAQFIAANIGAAYKINSKAVRGK